LRGSPTLTTTQGESKEKNILFIFHNSCFNSTVLSQHKSTPFLFNVLLWAGKGQRSGHKLALTLAVGLACNKTMDFE